MLLVFGMLPLLGGGLVLAIAVKNAGQSESNPAFGVVAWHNLPADKVFPASFGGFGGKWGHTWARQGIAEESTCDKAPLSRELATAVQANGCRSVLRATYVDTTGTMVTTIAMIVLTTNEDVELVIQEFDERRGGPPVSAYAVPETPAAGWKNSGRGGGSVEDVGLQMREEPYVVAASIGYVDGRKVGKLPEPWTRPAPASANETSLNSAAHGVTFQFQQSFHLTMTKAED